jgi:ABC-type uncharacterized transport system substrate-binding protein
MHLRRSEGPYEIVGAKRFETSRAAARVLAPKAKAIPVVFAVSQDPVENGLAASVRRPGGNATGLLSYAASFTRNFHRAAVYGDKILKGANPGDLAIAQPTKFEFVINLKTGKALGMSIPQTVLMLADRVVE